MITKQIQWYGLTHNQFSSQSAVTPKEKVKSVSACTKPKQFQRKANWIPEFNWFPVTVLAKERKTTLGKKWKQISSWHVFPTKLPNYFHTLSNSMQMSEKLVFTQSLRQLRPTLPLLGQTGGWTPHHTCEVPVGSIATPVPKDLGLNLRFHTGVPTSWFAYMTW